MRRKSPSGSAAEVARNGRAPHANEPAHARTKAQVRKLQKALLDWYSSQKRDLPWRRQRGGYPVWLSEVMLQQTRVETVIPYYERFLAAYPTVFALAEAPIDDVLSLWAGLGYYRRARMLHKAAGEIRTRGSFPETAEELRAISGIGPYTAGAVASIAYQERAALVDGNVHRVLGRLFAIDEAPASARKTAWRIAESIVPEERPGDFNQALMELGATICTPTRPRCDRCPVRDVCDARAEGKVDVLPRPPVKKAPPVERRSALLLRRRSDGATLFARRLADGRFGGLWEPPMVLGAFSAAQLRSLGLTGQRALEEAGGVKHVLTHRILEVTVYRGEISAERALAVTPIFPEYDTFAWATLPDLPGGVSTLSRKVLAWTEELA